MILHSAKCNNTIIFIYYIPIVYCNKKTIQTNIFIPEEYSFIPHCLCPSDPETSMGTCMPCQSVIKV